MTYEESVQYINSTTDYERMVNFPPKKFNLERISLLDKELGFPSRKFDIAHLAGTKGKGSTAAMIASALSVSGHKTALYTSPHVTGLRERIVIDRAPISCEEFAEAISEVAAAIERPGLKDDPPTFFELLTAAAFLHFAKMRVDWAVIETGLGGRLDATNIVLPRLCVITPIGLDHQAMLGDTLEKIAREKAGIVKSPAPVVSAAQPPEADTALREAASQKGVPLYQVGRDTLLSELPPDGARRPFSVRTPWRVWEGLALAMAGSHQRANAATALTALDWIDQGDPGTLNVQEVRRALSTLTLPGRIERLPGPPPVIADGAHNRDSIDALLAALENEIPHRRLVTIFACQHDKEASWILGRLAPRCAVLILTTTGNPRAADPTRLAALAQEAAPNLPIETAPTPQEALSRARALAGPGDLICSTGSLYLAGAIRREILGNAGTD